MVAIGFFLIAISILGVFLWWRGKLFNHRWLLWIFVFSVLAPQIANQIGWIVAEVGRQPWIVYGLLRTSEGLSKVVTAEQIWFSLILFAVIYLFLFILFIYLLNENIKQLVRASGSVGSNYIEVNEALSKKDFVMRIKICRKEAKESAYFLRLLSETNEFGNRKEVERLFQEAIELKKIFS